MLYGPLAYFKVNFDSSLCNLLKILKLTIASALMGAFITSPLDPPPNPCSARSLAGPSLVSTCPLQQTRPSHRPVDGPSVALPRLRAEVESPYEALDPFACDFPIAASALSLRHHQTLTAALDVTEMLASDPLPML